MERDDGRYWVQWTRKIRKNLEFSGAYLFPLRCNECSWKGSTIEDTCPTCNKHTLKENIRIHTFTSILGNEYLDSLIMQMAFYDDEAQRVLLKKTWKLPGLARLYLLYKGGYTERDLEADADPVPAAPRLSRNSAVNIPARDRHDRCKTCCKCCPGRCGLSCCRISRVIGWTAVILYGGSAIFSLFGFGIFHDVFFPPDPATAGAADPLANIPAAVVDTGLDSGVNAIPANPLEDILDQIEEITKGDT